MISARPARTLTDRAPRGRSLRTITAGALVWVQLVAVLHGAWVRHVTCEHGELVDDDSPISQVAVTEPARPSSEIATIATGDGQALVAHGEHEHCMVLGRTAHAALAASVSKDDPAARAIDSLPVEVAAPLAGQRLFRLAPKQSPPV